MRAGELLIQDDFSQKHTANRTPLLSDPRQRSGRTDRPLTGMGDDRNEGRALPQRGGKSDLDTHPETMPTGGMGVQARHCAGKGYVTAT